MWLLIDLFTFFIQSLEAQDNKDNSDPDEEPELLDRNIESAEDVSTYLVH